MAIREYVDRDGGYWKIWRVVPTTHYTAAGAPGAVHRDRERRPRLSVTPGMETGWLCFESQDEKRRLFPVPQGWEECPEQVLLGLLRQAQPVRRRIVEAPSSAGAAP